MNFFGDNLDLVQVMILCRQVTGQYLSQILIQFYLTVWRHYATMWYLIMPLSIRPGLLQYWYAELFL